jgi:Tfp pilus assembly protein PilO
MSKKVRRGNWLVTASLAVATAAYFMLVFLPVNRKIAQFETQLLEKQQYVAKATEVPSGLVVADKELTAARGYSSSWKQHSPHEKDLHTLFGKMSDLAKATGTTTTRFDPKPVKSYASLCEIPLAVGCTGKYDQVCDLLQKLESLPVSIWIESLEMKPISESGYSVSCEIGLAIFSDNSKNSD